LNTNMPFHQKFIKITRALNWLVIVFTALLLSIFIGAYLYNANGLGGIYISLAIFTFPFLLVPALTLWVLRSSTSRILMILSLLANLILLLGNLVVSYLTYVEGQFHSSNPQIYGNAENWIPITFMVSTPLILLGINITALTFFIFSSKQ